jgi:hypothetical protein
VCDKQSVESKTGGGVEISENPGGEEVATGSMSPKTSRAVKSSSSIEASRFGNPINRTRGMIPWRPVAVGHAQLPDLTAWLNGGAESLVAFSTQTFHFRTIANDIVCRNSGVRIS